MDLNDFKKVNHEQIVGKSVGADPASTACMIAQSEYLSLLKHVLQNKQLALFHESCKHTINFFEVTKMEPANFAPGKNQIILDNSVYDVSEASWNRFRFRMIEGNQSFIVNKGNLLSQGLQRILERIQLSDQDGFITFFTALFFKANDEQDKDAVKFMYSYIHYIITVNSEYKRSFKHTNLAIQTGEMICQYICHKSPQLWDLIIASAEPILDERNKALIMTVRKLLDIMEMPPDDSDVVQFFTNLGITNQVQRRTIIAYLGDLLYTESNMKVLEVAWAPDKRVRYHNNIKNVLAKVGSYLLQHFIEERIFDLKTYYKGVHKINYLEPRSEIMSQVLRESKPKYPFFTTSQVKEARKIAKAKEVKKPKTAEEVKKAREINKLKAEKRKADGAENDENDNNKDDENDENDNNKDDENDNNKDDENDENDNNKDDENDENDNNKDDENNNVNDKNKAAKVDDSLTPEQKETGCNSFYDILMKRMTMRVKQSERMTIKINNGMDFFRQNTLYSKYSIDYDYLCWFLQLLLNQTTDNLITWGLILSLYDLNYEDLEWLKRQDNTTDYFIAEIRKEGRNFESFITASQLKAQLRDYAKKKEYKYRAVIERYVDKMCQRKYFVINLIQECILYSPFKYIIFTDFIDTRGRQYINTPFLNINTNPMAKSFVK